MSIGVVDTNFLVVVIAFLLGGATVTALGISGVLSFPEGIYEFLSLLV